MKTNSTNYFSKKINLILMSKWILMIYMALVSELTFSQIYPSGFGHVQVANGIQNPSAMAFAPDGRIFVCQQNGTIRVIKNGSLLATAALSLTVDSWFERGLLGIAFDPSFLINNYVYLYYTVPASANNSVHNRVSRFTVNGDVITANSELILLELDNLNAGNHNGGALHFGPDGKLYIATGENAVTSNAQNLTNHHGKILRINSDGSTPADNPFIGNASAAAKRIWAYGLRNPYTFTFQPGTGSLYVNDVGAGSWEEINATSSGGANFGWPTTEGAFNVATYPQFTPPVYSYGHQPDWNYTGDQLGCAIVGGVFYNPSTPVYPSEYVGKYFFMEYCFSWINVLDVTTKTRSSFARNLGGEVLGLTLGNDGYLYFLHRSNGAVYRINYTNNNAPVITRQPVDITVSEGQPATFTVTSSGATPLTYQWMKNGVNINGANSASYTITGTVPEDEGNYSVFITNTYGSTTSNAATLTVTEYNSQPQAVINSPSNGLTFQAGDVISFTGSASDEEDGTIPAAGFKWYMVLYHNTHYHDGPPFATGVTNGTYTIPTVGETDHDIFYRLYLVISDSKGLTDTVYVDLQPVKSTFTLATHPSGLQLTLEGQPKTSPISVKSVVGMTRSMGVVTPQTMNGKTFVFDQWHHGGEATQNFTVGESNEIYTASFKEVITDTLLYAPIHDAYVRDGGSANTTFGTQDAELLVTKNSGVAGDGYNREAYFIFDISSFNATAASAKLKLYNTNIGENTDIGVYAVESTSWDETTITFANKPEASTTSLDVITVPANATNIYYEWDITAYFNEAITNTRERVSLQVKNLTATGPQTWWNSKEADNHHPVLEVVKTEDVVAELMPEHTDGIMVYPNPAKDFLYLDVNVSFAAKVKVELTTYLSDPVLSEIYSVDAGSNKLEINTGSFPKGIYLLRLNVDGENYIHKLILY